MGSYPGNLGRGYQAGAKSFGAEYLDRLADVLWPPPHRAPLSDFGKDPTLDELKSYRYTIGLSGLIPWSTDPGGHNISFNRRWSELTGAKAFAPLEEWAAVVHPEDLPRVSANFERCLRLGEPLDHEHRLRMRDGSYRWFRSRAAPDRGPDGAIVRWYGTSEDIHERKAGELRLEWLAHHDPLTGLPNRTLFQKETAAALEQACRTGSEAGLLVMDLDGFKQVNDQLGHDTGDRLLAAFAERISAVVPGMARIGGDEFAALLPSLPSRDSIDATFEAVHQALRVPLGPDFPRDCGVSIGCAVYPAHGDDAGELLKSADIALYEAKVSQPKRAKIFESEMRSRLQERLSMLSIARDALDDGRIVPFYQPKVDMITHKVMGFEALLRWKHPRRGHQLPASIAGAFQHPVLSVDLGERMMAQILADIRRWLDEGVPFRRIAVNVASPEFGSNDYGERVLERLHGYDVPPGCLEIEVTETVFLGDNGDAVGGALRLLSDAGVTIALDDFGTGYASLSHLQKFPVDVLKIDRSFVKALSEEASDRAIVNAVIGLAKSLNIATVAEGVETADQAQALRSFGCGQGQGYLFGRPTPAALVPEIALTGATEVPRRA